MSGIKGTVTIAPELEEEPDKVVVETEPEVQSFSGLEEIILHDVHHTHDTECLPKEMASPAPSDCFTEVCSPLLLPYSNPEVSRVGAVFQS